MDGTIHTCIPDGHLHRIAYVKCRIDTIDSPDDEHMVARNMQSIEININRKEMCVKLVICKNPLSTSNKHAPSIVCLDYTHY